MTIKIIEPPGRQGDSYIVAVDGHLRFVDPKRGKTCMGFANGCVCNDCLERAKRTSMPDRVQSCECDHPVSDGGDCVMCGKPIQLELQEAA